MDRNRLDPDIHRRLRTCRKKVLVDKYRQKHDMDAETFWTGLHTTATKTSGISSSYARFYKM